MDARAGDGRLFLAVLCQNNALCAGIVALVVRIIFLSNGDKNNREHQSNQQKGSKKYGKHWFGQRVFDIGKLVVYSLVFANGGKFNGSFFFLF